MQIVFCHGDWEWVQVFNQVLNIFFLKLTWYNFIELCDIARHKWCTNANSLNTILRHMPDEQAMGKTELNTHIFNLGCKVACEYIAYEPM